MSWFTPRLAVFIAVLLAAATFLDVSWGATHHRAQPTQVQISCALILTKNGQECR